MVDPTGPELLDALSVVVYAASRAGTGRCEDALEELEKLDPWQDRLRSLLRTPEETAVLRAAVTFAVTRSAWIRTTPEDDDASEIEYEAAKEALAESLRGITDERLAELMKEDKTDGL